MAWCILVLAGMFEVVWALAMKQAAGFFRPFPVFIMLAAMLASFWLLALAMRTLPLGTAYAVWTGIEALGTFVVGVVMLGENVTWQRMVAATLILLGIFLMAHGGRGD